MMVIRPAGMDELEKVIPLWKEMMAFHAGLDPRFRPVPGTEGDFIEYLRAGLETGEGMVLLAEQGEEVVGYIVGHIKSNPPVMLPPLFGYVSDIFVASARRRKGLGRDLFESLKEWFREQGVEHIELHVWHNNSLAQAFWRKMGFRDYLHRLHYELKEKEQEGRGQ